MIHNPLLFKLFNYLLRGPFLYIEPTTTAALISTGGKMLGDTISGIFGAKASKKQGERQAQLDRERTAFEKQKYDNAQRFVEDARAQGAKMQGILPSSMTSIARGKSIQDILRGSTEASTGRINDILQGVEAQRRQEEYAPTELARARQVQAMEIATNAAEEDALARVAMARANQGFGGGTSTADASNLARIFMNARGNQTMAAANAGFQNAEGRRGLQELSRLEQNRSLNLPFAQASNLFQYEQFPETETFKTQVGGQKDIASLITALSAPASIGMGVSLPSTTAPAEVGGLGTAFGNALSGASDTYGDYLALQSMREQDASSPAAGGGYQGAFGTSGIPVAPTSNPKYAPGY